MPVEAWTNLDLSGLDFVLPANVMHTIGTRYRDFRERTMLAKKQMQDMSTMTPLKPDTIARKMGFHKVKARGRLGTTQRVSFRELTAKQIAKERGGFTGWQGRQFKTVRGPVGVISPFPATPLVDSGNLLKNIVIKNAKGSLELSIGPQRAEIAGFHQEGGPHLPQRIHHSWSDEFVDKHLLPIIVAHMDAELAKSSGRWRKIA